MRSELVKHEKFQRLMEGLGVDRCYARGLLENLWDFATEFCPEGDLGRFTNEAIANSEALDWSGDADALFDALHDAGWIDPDDDHRWLLHDWHEHCAPAVHRHLARHGRCFASGHVPSFSRLTRAERMKCRGLWLKKFGIDPLNPPAPEGERNGAAKASSLEPLFDQEDDPLPDHPPERGGGAVRPNGTPAQYAQTVRPSGKPAPYARAVRPAGTPEQVSAQPIRMVASDLTRDDEAASGKIPDTVFAADSGTPARYAQTVRPRSTPKRYAHGVRPNGTPEPHAQGPPDTAIDDASPDGAEGFAEANRGAHAHARDAPHAGAPAQARKPVTGISKNRLPVTGDDAARAPPADRDGGEDPPEVPRPNDPRWAGMFGRITHADLENTAYLVAWFRTAAAKPEPVFVDTETNLLRILGAAERALEIAARSSGSAPKVFVKLVKYGRWRFINDGQEERARRRWLEFRRGPRPPGPVAPARSDVAASEAAHDMLADGLARKGVVVPPGLLQRMRTG